MRCRRGAGPIEHDFQFADHRHFGLSHAARDGRTRPSASGRRADSVSGRLRPLAHRAVVVERRTTRLVLSEYLKYLFAKVRMRFDTVARGRQQRSASSDRVSRRVRRTPDLRATVSAHWHTTGLRARDRLLVLVRSLLFNALFYVNFIVHMIVALPTLGAALSGPARLHPLLCADRACGCCASICGTKVEWRGVEKIPTGRLHRRLQAPIAVGDLRAVRRASTIRPTSSSAN